MFPPDLFLKGEELYESNSVVDINKLDKNLFSFTVREGGNIEVEWLKPLTKNQKASCECDFFKIGKMCRHAIAALIAYKSEFGKKEEEPEEKNEFQHKKFAALNINSILNNLTKEDLRYFVKTYASHDKKFATSFKVHFARKVDLQDNEKKYKSILDSIIRPVSNERNPYKASDVRALINVADEFISQADDALAVGQNYEAFLLIKTTIQKLAYISHNSSFYESDIEGHFIKCHKKLREIANLKESIDLKNELFNFLEELGQLSYYPFLNILDNAISILIDHKFDNSIIQEMIELQLRRRVGYERPYTVLMAMKIMHSFNSNFPLILEKKDHLYFDKIAEELFKHNAYETLEQFANQYRGQAKELVMYHIQSLYITQSKKLISESAAYFIETKDLRIVDFIKSRVELDKFEKFKGLISKSRSKLLVQPQIYMNYLQKVEALGELLNFLIEKRDFKYLMSYDELLLKYNEDQVSKLYESMVEDYLNLHVGHHSHTFIDELFAHFNKIKVSKLVNKIGLMIELKFPHRSRLEEHLK